APGGHRGDVAAQGFGVQSQQRGLAFVEPWGTLQPFGERQTVGMGWDRLESPIHPLGTQHRECGRVQHEYLLPTTARYVTGMSDKVAIKTDAAPAPAHSFPQGLRRGPILQVSGQGPVDPHTGEYVHADDVGAQTERTLRNVAAILRA